MTVLLEPATTSGTAFETAPEAFLPGLSAASDFLRRPDRPHRRVTLEIFTSDGRLIQAPWLNRLELECGALMSLRHGWDGARAKPVEFRALERAIGFVVQVMNGSTTAIWPQMVPLPRGGVQVEWHAFGNDVEIEIESDGTAFLSMISEDGETLAEDDLGTQDGGAPPAMLQFLDVLSRRVASPGG